jgi:hypothetical protein
MIFSKILKNFFQKLFIKFGYRISKINTSDKKFTLFKYKNYKEYRDTQIFFNKKKIDHTWADGRTLNLIVNIIKKKLDKNPKRAICHGSRNGFEQKFLKKKFKNLSVIGTDISETAKNFENSIMWDFHKTKSEWVNNYDFVYSNSLDQSYNPKRALTTWVAQLRVGGLLFLEMSNQDNPNNSSKMDPFGVEMEFFPYLIAEWFGDKFTLEIFKSTKGEKKNYAQVHIFVLKKLG